MVSRVDRSRAAALFRRFVAGNIEFDDVRNEWPTDSTDQALAPILKALDLTWGSDFFPNFIPDDPNARAFAATCMRFLESDLEYRWRKGPFDVSTSMQTKGLLSRLFATPQATVAHSDGAAQGDYSIWPFGTDIPGTEGASKD